MPDKQLTIATYAAGASLAAITLVYVFAPTFFIDGDTAGSASGRKRGVVGLVNSANDCFINSVLQALAGLGDLRIYLIRETHRRNLDGKIVYTTLVDDPKRKIQAWKLEGLQRGIVTQGLKDMLDALNERPLYKKTISAVAFVRTLEDAFRQRISRQQQDAQEFLQIVAERLCDEYHAGHRARRARNSGDAPRKPNLGIDEKSLDQKLSRLAVDKENSGLPTQISSSSDELSTSISEIPAVVPPQAVESDGFETTYEDEEGFPLEGKFESQIECLTCGFKPKPTTSTFCTLTLNVPQVSSTTLNTCFDGMFKTEYIDDFKCEKCRLIHAVEIFQLEIGRSSSEKFRKTTIDAIDSLKEAIETDPERPPKEVELPDSKFAPKRRIARHIRITKYPKIMAIHLSRSIFDAGQSSSKNSAKVSFPERLPLGGLLDQKKYKLLGLVTHKGSHNSGHYESFRRQNIYPPFSTPNTFEKTGVYSKSGTPIISTISSPQVSARQQSEDQISLPSTPELLSPPSPNATPNATPPTSSRASQTPSQSTSYPRPSSDSLRATPNGRSRPNSGPTSAPRDYSPRPDTSDTNSLRSAVRSARTTLSKVPNNISRSLSRPSTSRPSSSPSSTTSPPISSMENKDEKDNINTKSSAPASSGARHRRKRASDRWWRISDEKIKESKTSEVLGMQREVYLLFYEMEKGSGDDY